MAIRSQIRLDQLTGSLAPAGSESATLDASSLQGVLDALSGQVKRITGGDEYHDVAAGVFKHASAKFGADGDELEINESSGDVTLDLTTSDADLIFTVNDGGSADTEVFRVDGANSALVVAGANELQFRDAALSLGSSADGQLDIDADAKIEMVAPIVALTASNAVRISNDLELDNDSAVLKFGLDSDVSLTHVADTGLRLNDAMKLQFRDSAVHVSSDEDGYLSAQADTGVNINIGGTDEIAVTATESTFGGNIHIPDNAYIGAASAQTAIQIEGDGDVVLAADLEVAGGDITRGGAGAFNLATDMGAYDLTLGGASSTVLVPGDLTVSGETITLDVANLEVEDKFIGLNYSSGTLAGGAVDTGIVFGQARGDAPTAKGVVYRQASDRFEFLNTTNSPASGSIPAASFVDVKADDLDLESGRLYRSGEQALLLGASGEVTASLDMKLLDDNKMVFGSGDDWSIRYDEAQSDKLFIQGGGNGAIVGMSAGDFVVNHTTVGTNQAGDFAKFQGVSANEGRLVLRGGIYGEDDGTSADLVLSGAAGQDLRIESQGDLKLTDDYRPVAWTDVEGIKLATNAASWSGFVDAFGDGTSLLDAIVAAQGGAGTLQKRSLEVTGSAGYPIGEAVPLALDLDSLSIADVSERVDVYVNGQLMVSGAEVSNNGDYNLIAPHNGSAVSTTFEFALVEDDVIQAVVR